MPPPFDIGRRFSSGDITQLMTAVLLARQSAQAIPPLLAEIAARIGQPTQVVMETVSFTCDAQLTIRAACGTLRFRERAPETWVLEEIVTELPIPRARRPFDLSLGVDPATAEWSASLLLFAPGADERTRVESLAPPAPDREYVPPPHYGTDRMGRPVDVPPYLPRPGCSCRVCTEARRAQLAADRPPVCSCPACEQGRQVQREALRRQQGWLIDPADLDQQQAALQAATARMEALLLAALTPEQTVQYRDHLYFETWVGSRRFRITHDLSFNVRELDPASGALRWRYCTTLRGGVPQQAIMLAQLLYLRHNPAGFFAVANCDSLEGQLQDGLDAMATRLDAYMQGFPAPILEWVTPSSAGPSVRQRPPRRAARRARKRQGKG